MLISNSYLAPDAGKRRNKNDLIAEIWKAESFMKTRNISSDEEKIEWFIRGSADRVIRWFMKTRKDILTWEELVYRYIMEFASDENKSHYIQTKAQGSSSFGEYSRKMLQLVASKNKYEVKDIFAVVKNLNDGEVKRLIQRQMYKRPLSLSHLDWFYLIIERYEKKNLINHNKTKIDKQNGEASSDSSKERNNRSENIMIQNSTDSETNRGPYIEKDNIKYRTNTLDSRKNTKEKFFNFQDKENFSLKVEKTKFKGEKKFNQFKLNLKEEDLLDQLIKHFPNATNNEIKFKEPYKDEVCHIDTLEGKIICIPGRRRFEQSIIEKTKDALEKLEKSGIIRKSYSNWRNPIRPVLKPNGTVRVCTNLIALNALVVKESYPTPIMNDLIEKVHGSKYFSLIDLKDGYFQIEIADKDKEKTAFKFENMLYEWCRMPMGFKNAPSIFQKIMDRLLIDLIGKGVEVYLDDIVIHAKTRQVHDSLLYKVFSILEKNNLFININKLVLAKEEVKLLGILVNGKTQKIVEESKKDILEFPRPTDIKSLRRFLGKMNFYIGFIKDMSTIAVPLYEKTGKYSKFEWTEKMEESFNKLKESLSNEVSVYLPDYGKKFILETDASDTGLGACLMQMDSSGKLVPIRWASRKLTTAEHKYGITEKEMLAVVWGIEYFDYQLRGRKFSLITDHKALTYLKDKNDFGNNRIARWIDRIQDYDFDITYKKGEEVVSADALSRLYENDSANKDVKAIIWETHQKLLHRGLKSVEYELKKKYNWPNMKVLIQEVISQCEVCSKNTRKLGGGSIFVTSSVPLEITAIDIMKLAEEGKSLLVFVDYYTRIVKIKLLENRTTSSIINLLKDIFEEIGTPKKICSDNAKEFTSKAFFNFCSDMNILHHLCSVEHHKSNGRIERVIRTLRDYFAKMKTDESLETKVKIIEETYNNTYHVGIECTPSEALSNNPARVSTLNKAEGKYAKTFKERKRESFEIGQIVRIANKENLISVGKAHDRFQQTGVIIKSAGKDSYLVKADDGKIYKISHADLKGTRNSKSLSCGGDVSDNYLLNKYPC